MTSTVSTNRRARSRRLHTIRAENIDPYLLSNFPGADEPSFTIPSSHNCARNFTATHRFRLHSLQEPRICRFCNAKLLQHESTDMCCKNGKVILPDIPSPPELIQLFTEQTRESNDFIKYIRCFNQIFAMTSLGVHVDDNITSNERGVYSFRAQGSIYHKIGSILPSSNCRPRFLQLYIYDTDHEINNRLSECDFLNPETVQKIQQILHTYNPFVHIFRRISERINIEQCKIVIKDRPTYERQYILPTASQVAAIIVGDESDIHNERDIIVQTLSGTLQTIKDICGYYDPLQYPILLPHGTYGWDPNFTDINGRRVSCCDFYASIFQIRDGCHSLFLHAGRLLQQYAVDNFVKIESQRLRWIRHNQTTIRAENYQGLQDYYNTGHNDSDNVGYVVLPSSFVGGPRDMLQRYQDAMALVQRFGKPSIFLTFTCNPKWKEIKELLVIGQQPNDRPDILSRVFKAKFEEIKYDVITKGVLGHVIAYVYVIEFQKRGLPHCHMLLIFGDDDNIRNPQNYDNIVRAEIPSPISEPFLHQSVLSHMIHGPCGILNMNSICMNNGKCKKGFPKLFCAETRHSNNSYPDYRRRDTGNLYRINERSNIVIDNRWVVPYNPWLLIKYDCHINVEICSTIKSVKYLYKYVYKGKDRVSAEVRTGTHFDEIQHYIDGRWICSPEAFWKILKFNMYRLYPSVERLQIHLPNQQRILFNTNQNIQHILQNELHNKTMLTEFFTRNNIDENARNLSYTEFPEKYCWNNRTKTWNPRISHKKIIGRIYSISPSQGELYYLRLLLNHVKGPLSFDDLLTVNDIYYTNFKQAAQSYSLLENDNSARLCMIEASNIRMPIALRKLFATILVFSEPINASELWVEFNAQMSEDFLLRNMTPAEINYNVLKDVNDYLTRHGKSTVQYGLPQFLDFDLNEIHVPRLIQDERSIIPTICDIEKAQQLNNEQKIIYDHITNSIQNNISMLYFIDGPGGSGKTFLYRALLANLRNNGYIVLATATSGIAATLLPGGRTIHSRFKIPINITNVSICSIGKQSDLADLIRQSIAIIWDEASMANRLVLETLDRTLRDIQSCDLPFGGKTVIMGGDFRQILPVIQRGTKIEIINSCINKSDLWRFVKIFKLTQNIRASDDIAFSSLVKRIGDGTEQTIDNSDFITIPISLQIIPNNQSPINTLISSIYPNLEINILDKEFITNRAILTPLNEDVDNLNNLIIDSLSGVQHVLYSYDIVEGDSRNLYQVEFLNSLTPSGLPPHKLKIKKNVPIMLLRNLDPTNGLCNGTRLLCHGYFNNVIDAEIITGEFKGTRVFIPRIPMKTAENMQLPFTFTRKQFPIRLSFVMTINKSQGQTIPTVGIYLPEHVFSHGQLYVAISRGVSMSMTKFLLKSLHANNISDHTTKNIVYKEILL